MSLHGNNATPPAPAIAPGVDEIDPVRFAKELGTRFQGGIDPRVTAIVPGFDAPFFQAGLAGYSDAAMRIIARRLGAPFCVTEALLDRMLLGGGHGFDKADLQLMLDALPQGVEDQPLAGQIIGSDPDEMAAAALKMIEQASRPDRQYRDMAYGDSALPTYTDTRWKVDPAHSGEPQPADAACEDDCTPEALLALVNEQPPETYDPRTVFQNVARHESTQPSSLPGSTTGTSTQTNSAPSLSFATIDVNLACPVKKIDRKSRGGHWLSQPQGALDILRAVRAAVPKDVPCTVKLRRAYDDTPEMASNFEVIFNACYELGYAWTTVHARTVEQKYIGPSRWTFLKDLCDRNRDKIVFGSGDVWSALDIFRMMAYTGVTGVSVARGCIGNPWIFRQARLMIQGHHAPAPTLSEQRAVLLEHFAISHAINGEKAAGRMMRKFGIKFAQHHPEPEKVRSRMIAVESQRDWLSVMDDCYSAS
ncbi:MAG: tRNA-dihydrouridine synthase family protein [Phycisphaerales bacterium]|nr:tRNA-dihydrouridine synthase family protein [Phycisphaerales bacterium]